MFLRRIQFSSSFAFSIILLLCQVSHQTEELLGEHEHDWVRNQFLTTRDAHTANFFTEWLWGGMQYQLLHHLFPDMPRYYYPALRPKVEVCMRVVCKRAWMIRLCL